MKNDYLARKLWVALVVLLGAISTTHAQDKWTTLIHQTFDQFTLGVNNTLEGIDEAWRIPSDTKLEGFDMTKSKNLYQANGAIFLGSATEESSLVTAPMNFMGDDVKITLKIKKEESWLINHIRVVYEGGDANDFTNIVVTSKPVDDFEEVVVTVPAAEKDGCALKFYTRTGGFLAPGYIRAFIDEIKVEVRNQFSGTAEETLSVSPSFILFRDSEVDENSYEKEILVKGRNLTEAPTYEVVNEHPELLTVKAKGELTAEGGTIFVKFVHLKPGVHEAKVIVKYKDRQEVVTLKGRGLGGNPVVDLPHTDPVETLDETFESEDLPKGWTTYITSGYTTWKVVPSIWDEKNKVASMNIDSTSYDSGTAYLVSPCLIGKKEHIGELEFDFCMKEKTDALFLSTLLSAHVYLPSGSTPANEPLFRINYTEIKDFAIRKVKVSVPSKYVEDKYYIAFRYQGSNDAPKSVPVEVDNVKLTLKSTIGVANIESGDRIWRAGNVVRYENLNGNSLEIFTANGQLLITIPEADFGSIELAGSDRVIVRCQGKSVVF